VLSDPIADLLNRIKNGSAAKHRWIDVQGSRQRAAVLQVLKAQGYIEEFLEKTENKKSQLRVFLKYAQGRRPVFTGMKRLSSPGLRHTVGYREIPVVRGGLGITVVSTPKGVMDGEEARRQKVGGELICSIW
jgi:small subunit ribosomal protein S8